MCDEDLQKGQFICFRSYAKAGNKKIGSDNANQTAYRTTSKTGERASIAQLPF
jgi:hypothetical protein